MDNKLTKRIGNILMIILGLFSVIVGDSTFLLFIISILIILNGN